MICDLTEEFKSLFDNFKELHKGEQPNIESSKPIVKKHQLAETQIFFTYSNDIYIKLNKTLATMNEAQENYFSNAAYSYTAFSDQQRDQFDSVIKAFLEEISMHINQLKDGLTKTIFQNQTEGEHMKSSTTCLYQLYKVISKKFLAFLEFNQKKKQKIIKTISMDEKKGTHIKKKAIAKSVDEIDEELEKEANLLYIEKVSEQKTLEETKKTLESIKEVLHTMSNKVLQQQLLTSSFIEIGETGLFHIEKGNRNLIEAHDLAKQTGRWWILFFLMGMSLLVLDFLRS